MTASCTTPTVWCCRFVLSADAAGAVAANYVEADRLDTKGRAHRRRPGGRPSRRRLLRHTRDAGRQCRRTLGRCPHSGPIAGGSVGTPARVGEATEPGHPLHHARPCAGWSGRVAVPVRGTVARCLHRRHQPRPVRGADRRLPGTRDRCRTVPDGGQPSLSGGPDSPWTTSDSSTVVCCRRPTARVGFCLERVSCVTTAPTGCLV